MGHNIQYYTYPVNTSKEKIESELQEYAQKATWQEGGGGLHSPIRFVDRIMANYDEAKEFLENNDRGFYDQLAVKFKQIPKGKTTKKIDNLKAKLSSVRQERYTLNSVVAAQSFKADYVGCRHCGSKINRAYIKSNFCPICRGDMRSDTTQKKLKALSDKIEKLEEELQKEERALATKTSDIFWLVKIEYHT